LSPGPPAGAGHSSTQGRRHPESKGFLAVRALATWCFRHRRLVVLFWIVALVSMTLASNAIGTNFSNSFSLPDTESTRALNLLQSVSPKNAGDTERIVFETSGGAKVTDPEVQARVSAMLDKVAALPDVTSITSPFKAPGQISQDGTIGFATVQYDLQPQNVTTAQAKQLVAAATAANAADLRVAVSGQVAEQANPRSIGGTGPGILLALVVLLIVFGSFFAGILPILSALVSLGTAIGLIGVLSNVMKMPEFSTQLVLLIGLGVGIDYALFIVTRHRQGLMAGWDGESSVVNAVNTSGRAVLFAGPASTVPCWSWRSTTGGRSPRRSPTSPMPSPPMRTWPGSARRPRCRPRMAARSR
jgi:RND superfamily putative drug exporter